MKKISLEEATTKLLEGKSLKTESGSLIYEDYIGIKIAGGDYTIIIFFDHYLTRNESAVIKSLLQEIEEDESIDDIVAPIENTIGGVVGSISLDGSEFYYLD